MARLNEPPAAPAAAATTSTGESVDALRRRFIRQNRELAKNNSSQSLRIRSLELEVSRLLADNLELRNKSLRLQYEVDMAQRKAGGRVKADLREKLEALMGIVEGMEDGEGSEKPWQPTEKKPLEGNWRERQPLSELMRDSQMPTIQEDKQFPRRTLGEDEIQTIRLSDHSSNESPDLGPPPIAHFDYENSGDPVKNASPLGSKVSLPPPQTGAGEEEGELPASLSVNLETRRKRKDGQPRIEIRRRSLVPPQSPEKESEQPSTILRTGAKRKLADREAEKPIRPPSKGDFTFSRKTGVEEAKATSTGEEKLDQAGARNETQEKSARKVLGDKSVNMSPRKTAASTVTEKPEKDKPIKPVASRFQSAGKDKDKGEREKESGLSSRRRRTSSIPLPSPHQDDVQVLDTVEIPPPSDSVLPTTDLHPKTPLPPPDLFSPTPSEPSATTTSRTAGRSGTPPPGDLSTTSTDGGARPSRRTRGAPVNYAEPSLNAKMRRPSKQMVDAISGLQHHSRAMSSSVGRESGSRSMIKVEPAEESGEDEVKDWKNLPPAAVEGSPLGLKSAAVPGSEGRDEDIPPPSTTSMSSILAKSRDAGRRRESLPSRRRSTDLAAAMKKMEELEIYDFKESSSPLTEGSAGGKDGARVGKTSSGTGSGSGSLRSQRRHSSVPKSVEDGGGEEEKATRGPAAVARTASRRRSMML